MKSSAVFQLGTFEFELNGPTLRDTDGAVVPLRNQSLKVLACLCQSAGKIVAKSDINEQVWGDTHVTDASLVQCVREIRRALRDVDNALVKTFPRQGYMIEPTAPIATQAGANNGEPVIAVCEFQDRSTGADQNVLSDAIAEELIIALTRYAELSVVSRQASFGFEATENRTAQIVERTGAQYILTGYQQKVGQKLHVGVALIDAKTDQNIWTESYNDDADDLFHAQREIVKKIATALEYLIPNFEPEIGGSGKSAALGYHLKALTAFTKFTEDGLKTAEELGQKAIDADRASPYGYISLVFVNMCRHEFGLWHDQPGAELAVADEYADKALSLAPNFANAVMARGVVYMYQGRLEDGLACFRKTILINPNYSANRMNYAEALALSGDIQAALEQVELGYKRNKIRPAWQYMNTAFILWVAGRNQEAVNYLRNVPNVPLTGLPFKCALLASNGEVQAARDEMAKFIAERPNHSLEIERVVVGTKFRNKRLSDRWLDALKMAGMPDRPWKSDI